jgi:hypothetical protein
VIKLAPGVEPSHVVEWRSGTLYAEVSVNVVGAGRPTLQAVAIALKQQARIEKLR